MLWLWSFAPDVPPWSRPRPPAINRHQPPSTATNSTAVCLSSPCASVSVPGLLNMPCLFDEKSAYRIIHVVLFVLFVLFILFMTIQIALHGASRNTPSSFSTELPFFSFPVSPFPPFPHSPFPLPLLLPPTSMRTRLIFLFRFSPTYGLNPHCMKMHCTSALLA